ncbi:hypothetical protein [Staphylococcus pseudintermedius]|nr:hypothetical protein [Staphylococcus pseudintermedius]
MEEMNMDYLSVEKSEKGEKRTDKKQQRNKDAQKKASAASK